MPFARTITEGDLDSRSAEFLRELGNDAPSHDADFGENGTAQSSEATACGCFGDDILL